MRDYRNYRETLIESLKNNKAEMEAYLKASLEEYENDKNLEAFLLALKTIATAQGGMTKLAKKTSLARESLYRTLSKRGNPRLTTLETILHALGFGISVYPLKETKKQTEEAFNTSRSFMPKRIIKEQHSVKNARPLL